MLGELQMLGKSKVLRGGYKILSDLTPKRREGFKRRQSDAKGCKDFNKLEVYGIPFLYFMIGILLTSSSFYKVTRPARIRTLFQSVEL
jgi:hypothetical protein